MKFPVSLIIFLIGCSISFACKAGKIVIVQSATTQETPAEQQARTAREYLEEDTTSDRVVVIEGDTTASRVAEQRRKARKYLNSSNDKGNAVLVLKANPLTGAEQAAVRARSYVASPSTTGQTTCTMAAENNVGMIGDATIDNETGTSSVSNRGSVTFAECR
ncbi:hypothetical protein TI03_02690 [Achromatium sp. WMS1]|nr:hypothetical protein TI03_02690 [Achromatium sp. WMS1]